MTKVLIRRTLQASRRWPTDPRIVLDAGLELKTGKRALLINGIQSKMNLPVVENHQGSLDQEWLSFKHNGCLV